MTTTSKVSTGTPLDSAHRKQSTSFRDVPGTVKQLQQTQRTSARSVAIVAFCKGLRRGPLFRPFWDAVGGAAGLANLMAEFSLADIRTICRHLGRTASAPNARPERHAALAELVRILHGDEHAQRDPRPLRVYYRDVAPACGLDVVQEWDDAGRAEWTRFQRGCLLASHRGWQEQRFLKDLSAPAGAAPRTSFSAEKGLFQGDLAFSKIILETLIGDNEAMLGRSLLSSSETWRDFMGEFAMPLLNRLAHRRKYSDETRDEFLNLVVRCIELHSQKMDGGASFTTLHDVVRYAIQRWSDARFRGDRAATPATKKQTELCLVRLIEFWSFQSNELSDLTMIFEGIILRMKTHVDSYQLLRLILRHARKLKLDIDDDSPAALSRLRDLTAHMNLWPVKLFLHLDVENATGLLERLSAANLTGDFLVATGRTYRSSSWTVLEQKRDMDLRSNCGDVEIVRYLLLAKSKKNGADQLARARTLIHERRKKSEEGREWQQREFWARSAVNLCVAVGDLEMLDDTILWARRFNNQPLVARSLYNPSTFGTDEIRDLLSAVPDEVKDEGDASDRVAAVTKAIQISNRVLVHLVETIKMDLSQPSGNKDWQTLRGLPKLVVDCRLEKKNVASFDALFESSGDSSVELVWKPTIDTLVRAEGLMSASPLLLFTPTGTHVLENLPGRSGKIRADLTSFLVHTIKTHLGPEGLRQRMNKVVQMVTSIAESDQPWLAIPFIRDLILHGESADSVWHRSLLSPAFLSSLPYKAANDLLCTMANAMREKLQEQNARPKKEVGDVGGEKASPQPPAIKVTTLKMMAQLLHGTQIIGESAACDMLIGLLKEARHIDTLVAIVSSLLSFLEGPTCSPEIRTRILDALEESLTPVLPRLNQRRPVDWEAIESGESSELPDIADDKPLTSLLLSHNYESNVRSHEAKTRLINLLVRVPAQSALQNARWNKLFLARNNFTLDDGEVLPAAPVCPELSIKLLSCFPAHVPASTLTTLRDMTLANLAPTPGVVRVNEAVKADVDLVNSNAGKHWLAQFDNPGTEALGRFGLLGATALMRRAAQDPRAGGEGVTVQMVGDAVLAVADRAVACQLPETFEMLVSRLCKDKPNRMGQVRFDSRATWLAWRKHCVPLLRMMAANVDRLRREGPAHMMLPSSFQLRLSMLPIPYSRPPKEPAPAEEVDAFAVGLTGLVDWLVGRGTPYHDEFAQLKNEVSRGLPRLDYGRVALCLGVKGLGGQGPGPMLVGYLRLDLAGYLLVDAVLDEGCGVLPEVKQMVIGWVNSDDELVRRLGMEVEKKHKAVFSQAEGPAV